MGFVVNSDLTISYSVLVDMLEATTSSGAGPILANVKCHLYQTPHVADPINDTPLDFEECTAGGLAAKSITFGSIENCESGGKEVHGSVTFVMTDNPVDGQLVYGFYLTDAAGSNLYAQAQYDEPDALVQAGDAHVANVVLPLQATQHRVINSE